MRRFRIILGHEAVEYVEADSIELLANNGTTDVVFVTNGEVTGTSRNALLIHEVKAERPQPRTQPGDFSAVIDIPSMQLWRTHV